MGVSSLQHLQNSPKIATETLPMYLTTAYNDQKVDVVSTEDQRMIVREIILTLGILHIASQGDTDCRIVRSSLSLDSPATDRWPQKGSHVYIITVA
jgi:hypothetical protein